MVAKGKHQNQVADGFTLNSAVVTHPLWVCDTELGAFGRSPATGINTPYFIHGRIVYLPTNEWLIFMAHVGKLYHTLHGKTWDNSQELFVLRLVIAPLLER